MESEEPEETLDGMLKANEKASTVKTDGRKKGAPTKPAPPAPKLPSVSTQTPASSRTARLRASYPEFLRQVLERHRELAGLESRVVHEGDQFTIAYGSNPVLLHAPPMNGAEAGAITGVYAVAVFGNGYRVFEWLPAPPYADQMVEGEPVDEQLCRIAVLALTRRLPSPV